MSSLLVPPVSAGATETLAAAASIPPHSPAFGTFLLHPSRLSTVFSAAVCRSENAGVGFGRLDWY